MNLAHFLPWLNHWSTFVEIFHASSHVTEYFGLLPFRLQILAILPKAILPKAVSPNDYFA
jgi:hypothetical protein